MRLSRINRQFPKFRLYPPRISFRFDPFSVQKKKEALIFFGSDPILSQ